MGKLIINTWSKREKFTGLFCGFLAWLLKEIGFA